MINKLDTAPGLGRLVGGSLSRHVLTALLSAGLVIGFSIVYEQWSPMHRWNRAFGDASLLLIAFSMGLGPLARLFRAATRFMRFRRELGIHGCLLALVHTVIILVGWVEFDLMRLFGFEWHPELEIYVMFQHGFGLANGIGLAALVIAVVLAVTSNDWALLGLGTSAWKFLQMGVLPLWWLSVAHAAYFLFMHFLSFHRETPEPSPLQPWFIITVLIVLGLRATAYVLTVRRKSYSR